MFTLKKFSSTREELSFQETRDLVWSMANPDICFNVSKCITIDGVLDDAILTAAIEEATARHEALRTEFVAIGPHEFRRVVREACAFQLETLNKSALAETDAEIALAIRQFTEHRFEIDSSPLFRVLLISVSGPQTILAISMAHVISDASSLDILASDISKAYIAIAQGQRDSLPVLEYTLSDFVQSHRAWMLSDDYQGKLQSLRHKLLPGLDGADSDVDACKVSQQKARKAAIVRHRLPCELYAKLEAIAKEHKVTPPATLLTVTALSLSRLTGRRKLYFSHMLSNRHYPGMASVIGHLANAAPVFVDLQSGTVGGLISAVNREFYLSACGAGIVPLGAVNHAVAGLDRFLSLKSPFNQLMVNIPAPYYPMSDFAGLRAQAYRNPYAGFISNTLQMNYAYGPNLLALNCRCPEEDLNTIGQAALPALTEAIKFASQPADTLLESFHR